MPHLQSIWIIPKSVSFDIRENFGKSTYLENHHEEREEEACKELAKTVFSFEVSVPLDAREKGDRKGGKAVHSVVLVAGVRPRSVMSCLIVFIIAECCDREICATVIYQFFICFRTVEHKPFL